MTKLRCLYPNCDYETPDSEEKDRLGQKIDIYYEMHTHWDEDHMNGGFEEVLDNEPPKCNHCGAPMFHLLEQVNNYYSWNSVTRKYWRVGALEKDERFAICNECNEEVTEMFEDGVENYVGNSEES
jgi:hypothetical protein